MCVKAEENNLAWYVNNSNERLMEGVHVRKTKILNSERAQEKSEFKQDRQNATLNRWAEKYDPFEKCQIQLTKLRPGSGLGMVI